MSTLFKQTSISDTDDFRKFCDMASKDDNVFSNFKKNGTFTQILEHVSYEQGQLYIDEINKNIQIDLSLLDKFRKNDSVGNATTFKYEEPYGEISPSTLRYMKVLNDLIILFGDLKDKVIVEIGVGYGGQSKIIQDMFNVKEYNFIDLPEVLNLTKKYMSNFEYNKNIFLDFTNLPIKKYDLIISNYAITECSKQIQDLYIESVIKYTNSCYITGNDIGNIYGIQNYSKYEWNSKIPNSVISEETPKTHNNNYVIYLK